MSPIGECISRKGQAINQCSQHVDGQKMRGIAAQRELTTAEVARITELAQSSNLYAAEQGENRNKGTLPETLTIACCGRPDVVAHVTLWNPSFEEGPRRELRELLRGWRRELIRLAEQDLRNKR
jgi:hypothetical protein